MNDSHDPSSNRELFVRELKNCLESAPVARGRVEVSRTPSVVDVMGGIGEDCGALVLTATLSFSNFAAAWISAGEGVRIRAAEPRSEISLAASDFIGAGGAGRILEICKDAEWALPTCLALAQAVPNMQQQLGEGRLEILVHSSCPSDADFGRHTVQAAALIDVLHKLEGRSPDRAEQARIASAAVTELTGLSSRRTALTALCGSNGESLLQIRFHPQIGCERLELPEGIVIVGVRTRLMRPTTLERLRETRRCAEMGHRMIAELKRVDGGATSAAGPLATITPTEYVEHFRDRLPTKISGKAFIGRFGGLRGDNGELEPSAVYKIRSRSEHHIYENRRVHEFAAGLSRARRTLDPEALKHAGELMYASHWSHSQRCGIGGVETDQFVTAVRKRYDEGLLGAKVTAGGAGGEMVVLMRDDDRARASLDVAVAEAQSASGRAIETYAGSLSGAESFQSPSFDDVLAAGAPS